MRLRYPVRLMYLKGRSEHFFDCLTHICGDESENVFDLTVKYGAFHKSIGDDIKPTAEETVSVFGPKCRYVGPPAEPGQV